MFDQDESPASRNVKEENQFKWALRSAKVQMKENGRCPQKDAKGYESISGHWVARQRDLLRTGQLRPDREAILDAELPGWRDMTSLEQFEVDLVQVILFRQSNGRLPDERSTVDDERLLAQWVSDQVNANRIGRLEQDRIQMLDEHLGGWDRGGVSADALQLLRSLRQAGTPVVAR
ncbi:helicase associated domain-containing protein [Agromyces sp. NPDC057679]|uniref:helicase associated domain-containing protein n=1 Tax=Agromyces sp. NPDC057679 TaxID=3346207 RepID=UPI00366B8040